MLIQIRNYESDEVIFESDKENNTFKDTVEEAVRQGKCLREVDLRGADLRGADLYGADLSCADLSGADLHDAVLRHADLSYADLRYANLTRADLSDADISRANLNCANLHSASLYYSVLNDADLRGADLSESLSIGCNLTGADLTGAEIHSCFFTQADLTNTIMPDFPMACPDKGSFIGYKKIWRSKEYKEIKEFIVKLEIPEDAKRSSSTTNKCRCSKAKVLEIKDVDSGETIEEITNINEKPCIYKVGEVVYPDSFDECRWNECSNGIHFFMTEQDAIDYGRNFLTYIGQV